MILDVALTNDLSIYGGTRKSKYQLRELRGWRKDLVAALQMAEGAALTDDDE